MSGVNDFSQRLSAHDTIRVDAEDDPRELLSDLTGIRIFSVPGNEAEWRVHVDSSVAMDDADRAAVTHVLALLDRFLTDSKTKCAIILQADFIPADLKIGVLQSVMSLESAMTTVEMALKMMSGQQSMDVLMPKDFLLALRLVRQEPWFSGGSSSDQSSSKND